MAKYKLYDDYVAEQKAAAKETYGPTKPEVEESVTTETENNSETDDTLEKTEDTSAQTDVAEEKKAEIDASHQESSTNEETEVTDEKQTKKEKQQAALEANTTIGEKSIMNGGSYGKITSKNKATGERLDNIPKDKNSVKSEALGGTISRTKKSYDTPEGSFSVNAIHYKGVLGEFDYDPTQFELATISVGDPSDENGVTAQMPFLHYIGKQNWSLAKKWGYSTVEIPEGLKIGDYMFAGNEDIENVPKLPDSLESAHCMFLNCKNLVSASREEKIGESWDNHMNENTKWSMPTKLKDASGMFYGCSALRESFTEAGDSLEDARWMYGNTPNMENYTDCTSALRLRKEFQENMYTGSNKENVIDRIGNSSEKNVSMLANKEAATKTGVMVDELGVSAKETKELDSRVEKRETKKAEAGVVESDMSKYTAGQASTAKVKDSKGNTQSTVDSTEQSEKKESSNPFSSILSGLGFGSGTSGAGMMDRAFTTFLEYKLISKMTNSKLLGLGAAIGLQYAGVLPKSMAPILETVGKVVGKDTDLGKSLIGFSDKLKQANSSDTTSSKTGEKDDTEDVTTDITSSAKSLSSAKNTDITTAMKNNGVNIAKQGTLLNIAETPESELQVSKGISEESVKALETTMNEKAVNGSLDEETKTLMADSYMRMMSGLNGYNTGAKETIATEYADDTEKQEKATRGLGKTLRTVTAPIYDSLKQMDEKYHFLSDEQKETLNSYQLTGVTNYKDYTVGMNMSPETDVDVQAKQTQDSKTVTTDNENAGKSELELDTATTMPTNTKTLKSDEKSLSDNTSVEKTTDTKVTSADDDVVAKRNARSAEIESTFSDVLESERQLQNSRDYVYSN